MIESLTEWILRSSLLLAVLVPVAWLASVGLRQLLGARVGYAAWLVVLPALLPRVELPTTLQVISPSSPLQTITLSTMRAVPAGVEAQFHSSLLLLGWLIGAAVAAIAFTLRQSRFRRQLHSGIGASRPDAALVHRLRVLGLPPWVTVRSSRAIATPVVVGCMPPTLYLPDGLDQDDAVLAHEIAHVRHGDPCWSLLATVLRSLFWFLPWIHPAWKAIRKNQELAADEAVLCRLDRAQRYHYGCLLAATAGVGDVPAGQPWCGHSLLKERINMMTRTPPSKTMFRAGATLVAATVLAMSWALALAGSYKADARPTVASEPAKEEAPEKQAEEKQTEEKQAPTQQAAEQQAMEQKAPQGQAEHQEAAAQPRRPANAEPLAGRALEPLVRIRPKYPRQAAIDGATGYVQLEAVLTESGDVTAVEVVAAEPEGVFEVQALEAFSQWKFVPVRSEETGQPTPVKIRQTIEFVMD